MLGLTRDTDAMKTALLHWYTYGIMYVMTSTQGVRMRHIRPSTDVRPVTEFRANASAFLDQVQSTKRPVVLTQHGRSAAVLLDVGVYEDLLDEVALLRDIRTAEAQIDAKQVAPHSVVARRLKARLLK